MEEEAEKATQIVILPSPGMGHLIPLAEFAKRLVLYHHFSVTFIIPWDGPLPKAQKEVLHSLPKTINFVLLPPVNLDDLSSDVPPEVRIRLTVAPCLPSLCDVLKKDLSTTSRLSALVVDPFGIDAFEVAKEFQVLSYLFFPGPAISLWLFFYLPKLDEMYSCEYRDLPEPVKLPGCVPIHGSDLFHPIQDRKNEAYSCILSLCRGVLLADGILLNSFMDLEPGAIKAFMEGGELCTQPIYPVGPLIRTGSGDEGDPNECLKWLDDQPDGSVVFVSFGSGGVLSPGQLNELAFGLEQSEQRFLWVIRSPTRKSVQANFFNAQSIEDPFSYLPKGFLERTKGRGLVVPSWAPQIQVLNHGSTGGFLTHCGWNSTLESIVHGVPLIAWPLFAEQRMNAVMLVEDMKVALRPKEREDGIIGQEEIAKVVRSLMEGEEGQSVRSRMRELKDAAARVLSEEGSSTLSLSEVAQKWRTH
ncbi:hydroquinone glucosyltransferase-like [Telopea speciosissima]|uniref:hydroquinone glucosyltransferase-like n=1 Tax=Telopea speciosissima TaxID=54955 RepID=UPI001CC79D5C|nr:hydroquinone glucosyltransferase-like [Telopea speciosissima]